MIAFTVIGTPVTQGSLRAFVIPKTGRAVIANDSSKTKPWRSLISSAAYEARPEDWVTLTGGVWVSLAFSVAKPRSIPKSVLYPAKRGLDIDKAARAVLDALTDAGLWVDDSQVIDLHARKGYVGMSGNMTVPGVRISIGETGKREEETDR